MWFFCKLVRNFHGHPVNALQTNELIVWRDSVCAGDDCDAPHEILISGRDESLRRVTHRLLEAQYLASIAGGRATWILQTGMSSGQPLAVIAEQWSRPRFLVEPESPTVTYIQHDAHPHLYLRYWCQVDPERVFECLQSGKPLPDKYGR